MTRVTVIINGKKSSKELLRIQPFNEDGSYAKTTDAKYYISHYGKLYQIDYNPREHSAYVIVTK